MTKNEKISAALRDDITGQRFGRLVVLSYADSRYERKLSDAIPPFRVG